MAFLLDTNIAIHGRDGIDAVLEKRTAHSGAVLLSALSLAELQRGLYKNTAARALRQARLSVLLDHIPVLPFDNTSALAYAVLCISRHHNMNAEQGLSHHM